MRIIKHLCLLLCSFYAHAETIGELEEKVSTVEARLDEIAHLSFTSGVGSVGHRSIAYETAEQAEWVRVDWGEERSFDQVVLVPVISRNSGAAYLSDGFPVEFSLWVGGAEDGQDGQELIKFTEQDKHLPRVSPLVITCSGKGSWLELRTKTLSPRFYDGSFDLELAEILVFHGLENIALNAMVSAPETAERSPPRRPQHLTDGHVPYRMETDSIAQGTLAYLGLPDSKDTGELILDLGASTPISQIHLHAVESSDTIPQTQPEGFGIPRHFKLEGASEADFSKVDLLWEYKKNSAYKTGNILSKKLSGQSYRFLRIRVLSPEVVDERDIYRVGFAEIQVYAGGDNIALGKTFTSKRIMNNEDYPISHLTDGKNYYGAVLPQKRWLAQLSERENLENILPQIKKYLSVMYAQQKLKLTQQIWVIAFILALSIILALLLLLYKNRQITRIRERFAADLHDELGANLHAIGILGELARDDISSPANLENTLGEIKRLTARTAAATRMCINKQANPTAPDLAVNVERVTRRMMADVEWDLNITGEEHLKYYRQQIMDDLYLFYKECLVNLSRHSGASKLKAEINIAKKSVFLSVRDNGRGVKTLPASLQRRARLLNATASCQQPPAGGTEIHLTYHRPLISL